jgi:hypothetical protein
MSDVGTSSSCIRALRNLLFTQGWHVSLRSAPLARRSESEATVRSRTRFFLNSASSFRWGVAWALTGPINGTLFESSIFISHHVRILETSSPYPQVFAPEATVVWNAGRPQLWLGPSYPILPE